MNIQDAIMADFEVRKAAIDASVEPAIARPSPCVNRSTGRGIPRLT